MWAELGDLEAGDVVLDDLPLQALVGRPGAELVDVIDLARRAGLVVGRRNVAPGPVADAAVAGVGGHDRAVGRGALADHDDRAAVGPASSARQVGHAPSLVDGRGPAAARTKAVKTKRPSQQNLFALIRDLLSRGLMRA